MTESLISATIPNIEQIRSKEHTTHPDDICISGADTLEKQEAVLCIFFPNVPREDIPFCLTLIKSPTMKVIQKKDGTLVGAIEISQDTYDEEYTTITIARFPSTDEKPAGEITLGTMKVIQEILTKPNGHQIRVYVNRDNRRSLKMITEIGFEYERCADERYENSDMYVLNLNHFKQALKAGFDTNMTQNTRSIMANTI